MKFSNASFGALQTKSYRDLGSCHKGLYVTRKKKNKKKNKQKRGKAKTIGGSFVAPKKEWVHWKFSDELWVVAICPTQRLNFKTREYVEDQVEGSPGDQKTTFLRKI